MSCLKLLLKTLVVTAVFLGVFAVIPDNKASAHHMNIPGYMPDHVRNYLSGDCGHSGQSPSVISWISVAGWPMVQTLDVDYGTNSVQLQYNMAAIVCYNNSQGTDILSQHVVNAWAVSPPATISGLTGSTLNLSWGGGSHRFAGEYRQTSRQFTYSPTGGFRNPGWYTLAVDGRTMNHFASGTFACTAPGGGVRSGWQYTTCPYQPDQFSMYINVRTPPVDRGECTVTSDSLIKQPGELYRFTYTARNTSYNGGITWGVHTPPQFPPAANRYRLQMLSPASQRMGLGDEEIQGPGVTVTGTIYGNILSPNRTTTWERVGYAPTTSGTYQLRYRIYGHNQYDGLHYVGAECSMTITVANKPFHRVFGGDVIAGAGTGTPCYDPNSRIIGWNADNFRAFGVSTGSGGQLAVMALNQINDFSSGQVRNNVAPHVNYVDALTFANSGSAPANTAFGGGLDQTHAICPADFWVDGPNRSISGNNLSPNDGDADGEVYRYSSDLTLRAPANGDMQQAERVTIYVEGDVYIPDDITFQNTTYASVERIPSFRLIVRGNIFIAGGVSELTGLYVAIPTNVNNGKIYTCSNGFAPPTQTQLDGACQNRLTIYGALIADLVKFARTGGTLLNEVPSRRAGTTEAAERIIYTPEFWLNSDFNPGGDAEAFDNLPPVL